MQENDAGEFNIRRYWALVVKRRYIAIGVALAVISAFTWGSLLWPKTYETSSTVLVERGSNLDPFLGTPQADSRGVEDQLNIIGNALTSRNMVGRVIKKLYPDSKTDQYEWLVTDLPKKLEVIAKTPKEGGPTGLFVVKYSGKDPVMVRDLVNTLIAEYIGENVGKKRADVAGDYAFLKVQLQDSKKKLDESDRAIRDFKQRYPDVDSAAGSAVAARVDVIEGAKVDADVKLNESLRMRDSLKKQLASEKPVAVEEMTEARLNKLNNQLTALQARYTDDYPEVRKVKNEIEEEMKNQAGSKPQPTREAAALSPAYQQLKRQLADINIEIASLRARSEGLSRQRAAAQGKLGHAAREQEEWAILQRDRGVYQKTYDDLSQKLENAKVSKELELASMTAGFKVIDPAILPDHPVKPNIIQMIFLGIVLGAVSGIGAAIGLDNFARSFTDEESIETKYSLPVLATIHTVTTEADRVAARKVDTRVFAAAGIYFLLIMLVLAKQFLYR